MKVLGIDHALSQDIKGDLRTLHDLLTISDHQFKRILSSNLSFSFEHIKKMKAERQEYTEFLSRVAAVQASKLNKASATLKDYFQLHGKAFSKIHGDNLSFAERQDLCDFYDHNQKINKVVQRACQSCGLEKDGSDYIDAVEKFKKHGIKTKYDFHCLDEDVRSVRARSARISIIFTFLCFNSVINHSHCSLMPQRNHSKATIEC